MLCTTFRYSTMLWGSIQYIPMYLITAQSAVRCNTKHIVQWGGPFLQSGDPLIVSSQETPDLWSGGSRLLVFRVPNNHQWLSLDQKCLPLTKKSIQGKTRVISTSLHPEIIDKYAFSWRSGIGWLSEDIWRVCLPFAWLLACEIVWRFKLAFGPLGEDSP